MPLNTQQLLNRMEISNDWKSRLIIEPLFESNLNTSTASIDLHLGNQFITIQSPPSIKKKIINKNSQQTISYRELFIPMGEEFPILPGQFVLCSTMEWIRLPQDLMAYVVGRSMAVRRGLLIVTGTAIQPGFFGTLTLEVSNLSDSEIILKPGMTIGELLIDEIKPIVSS
jgi:dCTP deaminase